MSDILLGLQQNHLGIITGLLVALLCSYIGVYVVLKRVVFVSVSLAEIASAGIALAFLIGLSIPFFGKHPMLVSLIVTLLGALLYSQQTLSRKIPQEAIIGIGYLIASALTLMFIVRSPKGMDDVKELLDGNIITVQMTDVKVVLGIFILVTLMHFLFYKQFLYTSFDPEMAATHGYKTRVWELFFYLLMGLTISAGIQYAGLLAVFAYMVIPAVTGISAARRMPTAFMVAGLSAVASTLLGFCWALKSDLPTSPPIIAVSALILAFVWFPQRWMKAI
jgi:ABC-type Mn2+/Zn2+ transport system permease subunit